MISFINLRFLRSKKYDRVVGQEEDQLLGNSKTSAPSPAHARPKTSTHLISLACTFILAGLTGFFFTRTVQLNRRGSFFDGYTNELSLAIPSIRVSQVGFTGGIKFHDNGTMYRDQGPGPHYVGPPNPEIDANWEAIIGTRYLAFTHDQKAAFQVNIARDENDGLYRAGPDVFHSLHCVNKLRKTIDSYLYKDTDKPDESKVNIFHIEHCLDFLRQLVACSSDLTPIPLVYSKGAGFAIPDFEQVHTCRNFDSIRDWALKQNVEALKTVEGTSKKVTKVP